MDEQTVTKDVVVCNTNGLHIRPVSLFVEAAMRFDSEIDVENVSSAQHADGKSVMAMLMLFAPKGSKLKIVAAGKDCREAADTLADLVCRGFDED